MTLEAHAEAQAQDRAARERASESARAYAQERDEAQAAVAALPDALRAVLEQHDNNRVSVSLSELVQLLGRNA